MRLLLTLPAILFLLSSCATDPYKNAPEGTVSETEPEGYEKVTCDGIEYWFSFGHYYRYWPHYGWVVVRPPWNRPPYPKPPKPVHPIEPPATGKPPVIQPLPTTRPATRPMPSTPSLRPSTPAPRPMPRPMPQPSMRR